MLRFVDHALHLTESVQGKLALLVRFQWIAGRRAAVRTPMMALRGNPRYRSPEAARVAFRIPKWTAAMGIPSSAADAIYGYLTAVHALVTWWAAEGQDFVRAQRAVLLSGLHLIAQEDPFAAVIRCTADPTKADKRTRSKWSRLMRYVGEHKLISEPLDRFVKRKGGINECAGRFGRGAGRRAEG